MAVFSYKARDVRGELVHGTVHAESLSEASRNLRAEGKYVLDLTPGIYKSDDSQLEALRTAQAARHVRRGEVIDFCHQLSVMLDAGVPLGDALEAFNKQGVNTDFVRISRAVEDEVKSGAPLSSALARWPRIFPRLMVTLIRASEASGTMGLMLNRVSKYMGKEHKTARQVRGALTYPCVMIVLSLTITIFLMTFVLPRFAAIYSKRNTALPVPTQIMMGISGFCSGHWQVLAMTIAIMIAAVILFHQTEVGKRTFDWTKLHLPILGKMFKLLYLTRSARTMATLVVSGVDLLEAVRITKDLTNNVFFQQLWDDVAHDLEEGNPLSSSFGETTLLSPSVIRMISAGEQTGRLGTVMERIGETSEEELDEAIELSTQFIEPAMIAIMGAVVGFVAISMLLPIFTISRTIHQ